MVNDVYEMLDEGVEKAIARLGRELSRIRTGRANPSLLDTVKVDYYGTLTPIAQLATVKVPEPRMMTIAPWEKTILKEIEKAILASDIGLTPNNDGTILRLTMPPLTGERRKELARDARRRGEDAKIGIRAARRDANEMLQAFEKDGDISEDEMHGGKAQVQKRIDAAIKRVDDAVAAKEAEILEV